MFASNLSHRDRKPKYVSKFRTKHGGDGKRWRLTPLPFLAPWPSRPPAIETPPRPVPTGPLILWPKKRETRIDVSCDVQIYIYYIECIVHTYNIHIVYIYTYIHISRSIRIYLDEHSMKIGSWNIYSKHNTTFGIDALTTFNQIKVSTVHLNITSLFSTFSSSHWVPLSLSFYFSRYVCIVNVGVWGVYITQHALICTYYMLYICIYSCI